MGKNKPIKTEWNQDDRQDLSDMTKEEMEEFHKKLIDVFSKEYKIPKKYYIYILLLIFSIILEIMGYYTYSSIALSVLTFSLGFYLINKLKNKDDTKRKSRRIN